VTPTAVKKDKNACGAFVGRIFAHILTHSGSSGSNTVCVQVTLSAPSSQMAITRHLRAFFILFYTWIIVNKFNTLCNALMLDDKLTTKRKNKFAQSSVKFQVVCSFSIIPKPQTA
jgi:hypothetical protein